MTAMVHRYSGDPVPADEMYAVPKATFDFWDEVYDILEQECGATADEDAGHGRKVFRGIMGKGDCPEFRFMGSLGFGGKLYASGRRLAVGYYSENRNDEREEMACRANQRLMQLVLDKGIPTSTR